MTEIQTFISILTAVSTGIVAVLSTLFRLFRRRYEDDELIKILQVIKLRAEVEKSISDNEELKLLYDTIPMPKTYTRVSDDRFDLPVSFGAGLILPLLLAAII